MHRSDCVRSGGRAWNEKEMGGERKRMIAGDRNDDCVSGGGRWRRGQLVMHQVVELVRKEGEEVKQLQLKWVMQLVKQLMVLMQLMHLLQQVVVHVMMGLHESVM